MKPLKMSLMALLIIVLAVGITELASATLVISLLTVNFSWVGGVYTYTYSVGNDGSSDETIYVFDLDSMTGVFDVMLPNGWEPDSLADPLGTFVHWMSGGPYYDIQPGDTLGGPGVFEFKSYSLPGYVDYSIVGWDSINGQPGTTNSGQILGPVVVPTPLSTIPEPSSMLLLGFGISGLAGYVGIRLRRKK